METTVDRILEISNTKEGKNLLQLTVKCMEELGELSEAVLSYTGASGSEYKMKTLDDVKEEAIDIFIVATSIMGKLGMSKEDIIAITEKKIGKWESKINK